MQMYIHLVCRGGGGGESRLNLAVGIFGASGLRHSFDAYPRNQGLQRHVSWKVMVHLLRVFGIVNILYI